MEMVRFINRYTGNNMWVAEDRVEEYKALGHTVAPTDQNEKLAKPQARRRGNKK